MPGLSIPCLPTADFKQSPPGPIYRIASARFCESYASHPAAANPSLISRRASCFPWARISFKSQPDLPLITASIQIAFSFAEVEAAAAGFSNILPDHFHSNPQLDSFCQKWDYPTMLKTATTDQKRRIVLPGAKPGEVYAIRELAAGHLELSRMLPAPKKRRRRSEVEKMMNASALTPQMNWDTLRKLTRES
jgi:hypothetical protein